jgi:CheY-like chemotaxis protein
MNKNKVDLQAPRILLVDDQPANLNLLYELLEGEGYRISVAPSGPVALKVVEQAEPDLILLDVMMPGMDGFEVCRRLKQDEKTQDIPVVFITALTEDVVQGFQAGGVDYITKPFRDEEVLVRVRTHLRINRLQREVDARNAELLEKNQALEEEIAQRKTLKGQLSVISEREAERWGGGAPPPPRRPPGAWRPWSARVRPSSGSSSRFA